MQALYEKAMKDISSKRKTSFPWKRDEPFPQPYYTFSQENDQWIPVNPEDDEARPGNENPNTPSDISLYTWNIDFMLPHASARMTAALAHLTSLINPSTLSIIFLQEMLATDLNLISSHSFIRTHFHMTDLTSTHWESGHYGTVTLIDKRLPITSLFRVHYSATKMERDGLFVDVLHPSSSKPLRLCNTHLESLIATPPLRPSQLKSAAKFMHSSSVQGAILAGDLNAIQPFDRTLHSDQDLQDAYLALGGDEDDAAAGHTWGQQATTQLRRQFGTSRMDKVYYCGGVRAKSVERFGVDVVLSGEDGAAADLIALGMEKAWVTDHLGITVRFEVVFGDNDNVVGDGSRRRDAAL